MKTFTYKENNYELIVHPTTNFKTNVIDFVFNIPNTDADISNIVYLKHLVTLSSKKYPTARAKNIMLEKLYKSVIYASLSKNSNCLNLTITLGTIDDNYTEPGNTGKALDFLFEMINNPNIINGEFNRDMFNITKKDMLNDIDTFYESPGKVAFQNSINNIDPDSYIIKRMIGDKETVKKVTPKSFAKYYQEFFKRAACKIFAVGNFDPDKLNLMIKEKNHFIANNFTECKVSPLNVRADLPLITIDESKFEQSLLTTYLTTKEDDLFRFITVGEVFNDIFGGSSTSSKLGLTIREKHSLCYSISSGLYYNLKLVSITAGIAAKNFDKTISLIKQVLTEMQEGKFSEEDINNSKKQILFRYNMSYDSVNSICNMLQNKPVYNLYPPEDIATAIEKVTKQDIIDFANNLTIINNYLLKEKGDNNEKVSDQ